jgi:putative sigma-54 modulation protein
MDIIIESPGFTAGPALESFVREKLDKLEREGRIIRANVTLFLGPENDPERNHCEIRLEIPGNDIFVKKSGDSFEKAIVKAADVVEQQYHKEKEKQSGRARHNPEFPV